MAKKTGKTKKESPKPKKKDEPKVGAPAAPIIKEEEKLPEPPKPSLLDVDPKKLENIRAKMGQMRYKDLQTNCVIRGIDFDFMVSKDTNGLQTWLLYNWDMPCIQERLQEFDSWREIQLEKAGRKGEPFVRLAYFGPTNKEGELISIKKPENLLSKPKKRERDEETGIFKGTKKALTLDLSKQGVPLDKIIEQVKEKFPEAKDKSIKIWIKRFQNANKKKK